MSAHTPGPTKISVGDLVYVTTSADREVLMRVTEIDEGSVYGCLASETDSVYCAPSPRIRQWLGLVSDAVLDGAKVRMREGGES